MADALVSQVYSDGQRIIKENDDPDGMYFIEDGTVRVSVTNEVSEGNLGTFQILIAPIFSSEQKFQSAR